jgi:hypothetical protein
MHWKALTGIQQLDEQACVGAEALHMRISQPGARILVDRGLQGLTVGKDAEAKGFLTGKHRGRCNPILRLALAGGRLSPKIRDLPAAAVEAIGRTVGRKQDEVHETALLRTSAARKSPTKESLSPTAAQNRGVRLRELFLPLLGNWTGIEQQAASPWAPPTSARAMIVFKLDVGGQVVLQDYRQVRADAEEFSGHGVFMIDNAEVISPATPKPILWWFFDSYGYPPQPAHGGWQNGELIMQKTTPRGAAEHRFAVTDDQLSYRIRLRLNDSAQMEDFLSGTYRRISGH